MAKGKDQGERSEIQAGNYIVWLSKAFLRFLFSPPYRQPYEGHKCLFVFVCLGGCYLLLDLKKIFKEDILLFYYSFCLYFFVVGKRHKWTHQNNHICWCHIDFFILFSWCLWLRLLEKEISMLTIIPKSLPWRCVWIVFVCMRINLKVGQAYIFFPQSFLSFPCPD